VPALSPLLPIAALSALLNTWALGQNGYANVYYSAGVKAMLRSWHNLFFLAADPGGLISIDKPPLALWLQAASARVFGFSPLSLLLPEALAGVATVVALYLIVRPRWGTLAASASALVLATFPSFVAVSRDNNVDALLILLLTLACGAALRATESGRLRTLLGSAVLLALAFNTKALAAYLPVPGIAAGYLLCAPGPLRRRAAHLLLAGALCAGLSLAWMVAVDLTPAKQRPFVGSSTNNSELGLTFGYNGLGRARGQRYGPGEVVDREVLPEVSEPLTPGGAGASGGRSGGGGAGAARGLSARGPGDDAGFGAGVLASLTLFRLPDASPDTSPKVAATITEGPEAFGDPPEILRLFGRGFGDQGSWLLLLALAGVAVVALTRPARRDPKLAYLIIFGGFLLSEAVLLSASRGIVHPYYLSALAPGTAALIGAGLAALSRPVHRRTALLTLAALAAAGGVAVQIVLLHRAHYLLVWQIALPPVTLACALLASRVGEATRSVAVAVAAVLLIAPTAYSTTTWRRPVEGTFPAAGPRAVGGNGGAELSRAQLETDESLIGYVLAHGAGGRFQLLTQASLTADSPILLGLRAASIGGYGGVDPALDGRGLARLVASGQARYIVLGGSYAYLGGNAASTAAARVCPEVPVGDWRGAGADIVEAEGLYLLDCAGHARQLAGA
jgi:4-amino-4-deoxy-L-arabinose transferase-like glycosyltransferase